jgi:SAM-dependent methyltransferase
MATILNLGCGTRTSAHTVDIDWSIYQRLKANPVGRAVMPALLSGERRDKFLRMDDNIIVHDLRKGIPVAEQSADAVYHSHVLEHIDRDAVPTLFGDILRVLRPGGIHRIVVPDLERYVRDYLASFESGVDDHDQRLRHDKTVAASERVSSRTCAADSRMYSWVTREGVARLICGCGTESIYGPHLNWPDSAV